MKTLLTRNGKQPKIRVQRALIVHLFLTASLFAIWMTLQFPRLVSPYSDAKSFPPNSKNIVSEATGDPKSAGMRVLGHATTGSRLPSSIPALSQDHSFTQAAVSKISATLPLYFEANYGQADVQVKFVSRGRGYTLSLTPNEVLMVLQNPPKKRPAMSWQAARSGNLDRHDADLHARGDQLQTTVRMKLVGATAEPKVFGTNELPGKSNYFVGDDPKKWRKNVPQYAKVRYENVYPGIDLVFYGNESQLEFDFIVAPGVDPAVIQMVFEGADKIDIDKEGHLTLRSSGGSVRVKKPFIYQELNGIRQEISGRYLLNPSAAESPSPHLISFELGPYDSTQLLVIDPGLEFSTFLGWSGLDDGNGIALDAAGNIYVVGSSGLGYGVIDVFVVKFSPDFTLLYATVFGGSINGKIGVAGDWGRAIAVDATGNAYVTGRIESSDFPTTDGTTPIGYADAFVAKFSSDGSTLLFSRRLGGSGQSDAYAIALDPQGNPYVTGWTTSPEFPTTPGALDTTHPGFGYNAAFVVKLSADGSKLLYSTFLGGDAPGGVTQGYAIAVDASGNAHVTGATWWFSAPEFPATPGAFDTSWNGGQDAFVAKLNADGSQLLYATYIGGSAQDSGWGIALDAAGNAYVTGSTESSDFPTTPGAFERTHAVDVGSGDAFVVKFSTDGSKLLYSTFLGGTGGDEGRGIAVDDGGNAYVVGTTCSADFPTTAEAFSRSFGGGCSPFGSVDGDAYVAKLSSDGSRLLYSTYLGGGAGDEGWGMALDAAGNVYVTGQTESLNFPTTPGAFKPGGGPWDAFVAKLSVVDTLVNPGTVSFDAIFYHAGEDAGAAVITAVRRNGRDGEVSVDFATSDSTATAGVDYVAASGTLVFADGETRKSFTVPILDDKEHEGDESVVVTLSNVQGGATLAARNWGVLIITDQDPALPPPSVTITDVAVAEGNTGTTLFNFNVSLSSASSQTVTVSYNTADGTAVGGASCTGAVDYKSRSGMVTFIPGQTLQQISIEVCGNLLSEPNEIFFVNLTGASNANIADAQSVGTIINDDGVPVNFAGNGRSDIVVFRGGAWLFHDFTTASQTGGVWTGSSPGCTPAPMDYDGDGTTDFTQLCGGAWHFYNANGSYNKGIWVGNVAGDRPVPADYDGDGTDDVVVYRGGAWLFYDFATGAFNAAKSRWTGGGGGCIPVPMDYNGDGKKDFTQLCNGAWHFYNSNGSLNKGIWTGGVVGDIPVPADYDGSGMEAVVAFRGGAWRFYDFGTGLFNAAKSVWTGMPLHWTGGTSLPAPIDYDGDGKVDFTVYSGGPWHFYNANGSYNKGIWTGGVVGDRPISRRLPP